ncbi:MAG: bifunctional folylpolyglutamate synthase/dihydrofolate synthase [Aureliella sp.]
MDEYQSSIDYLYAQINYERIGTTAYNVNNFRLDRMRRLMELIGNPQDDYRIIHVAGTKGKGTVCHLLSSILLHAGYRCGLYTSPHLLRLEERFQAGNHGDFRSPTKAEMVELIGTIRKATETYQASNSTATRPTFFEQTTAMAFLHFARRQCEAVVLEVGLGGRLDSTNICSPELTVVTSISLDHQKQLGDTVAEIAAEKAGIIKPGIPVVNAADAADAIAVVQNRAAELESPCFQISRDLVWQWSPISNSHTSHHFASAVEGEGPDSMLLSISPAHPQADVTLRFAQSEGGEETECLGLQTSLLGRHQAPNVAAAVASIRILQQREWVIPDAALKQGVLSAQPPARLQCVGESPTQVIDTAHNPYSIQAGLDALNTHFPGVPIVSLFASSKDKDFRTMLQLLLQFSDSVILTEYLKNPRAASVHDLRESVETLPVDGPELISCQNPDAAYCNALNVASSIGGLVYVAGSFFLAAEVLPLVQPDLGKAD